MHTDELALKEQIKPTSEVISMYLLALHVGHGSQHLGLRRLQYLPTTHSYVEYYRLDFFHHLIYVTDTE